MPGASARGCDQHGLSGSQPLQKFSPIDSVSVRAGDRDSKVILGTILLNHGNIW